MMDAEGLDQLVADLTAAPRRVQAMTPKVLAESAKRVRDGARGRVGGRYTPHYPQSITFDVKPGFGAIEAEIGPDKGLPQGPLGNILEFGTSNNGPRPHLGPALDEEAPGFADAMGDLGEEAL